MCAAGCCRKRRGSGRATLKVALLLSPKGTILNYERATMRGSLNDQRWRQRDIDYSRGSTSCRRPQHSSFWIHPSHRHSSLSTTSTHPRTLYYVRTDRIHGHQRSDHQQVRQRLQNGQSWTLNELRWGEVARCRQRDIDFSRGSPPHLRPTQATDTLAFVHDASARRKSKYPAMAILIL